METETQIRTIQLKEPIMIPCPKCRKKLAEGQWVIGIECSEEEQYLLRKEPSLKCCGSSVKDTPSIFPSEEITDGVRDMLLHNLAVGREVSSFPLYTGELTGMALGGLYLVQVQLVSGPDRSNRSPQRQPGKLLQPTGYLGPFFWILRSHQEEFVAEMDRRYGDDPRVISIGVMHREFIKGAEIRSLEEELEMFENAIVKFGEKWGQ